METTIEIENGKTRLTATCPDEDSEMSIHIKDKYYTKFVMSLEEAERLGKFLLAHVKEGKKHR